MHFTGTLYRNPREIPSPYLEITQGCTHNSCKFCNMYKDVPFHMSPLEWVEEDVKEIASVYPNTTRLQIVGANPFALSFDRFVPILEIIHKYLPKVNAMTMGARVTDIRNKSVDELKQLREMGIEALYIGTESGDEWTLQRINKGYHADEIVEQCKKLEEAGIQYWVSYLNGVAGKSHSKEHAIHTAEVFNQLHPLVVGSSGLVLFPDTVLAHEAENGTFDPLSEKEMMEEMKLFLETLTCDSNLITHHTFAADLTDGDFLKNKKVILQRLQSAIDHADEEKLSFMRSMKRSL